MRVGVFLEFVGVLYTAESPRGVHRACVRADVHTNSDSPARFFWMVAVTLNGARLRVVAATPSARLRMVAVNGGKRRQPQTLTHGLFCATPSARLRMVAVIGNTTCSLV